MEYFNFWVQPTKNQLHSAGFLLVEINPTSPRELPGFAYSNLLPVSPIRKNTSRLFRSIRRISFLIRMSKLPLILFFVLRLP